MKIYVVDTNLVFSAVLNLESRIGKFIMYPPNSRIKFYSPSFLEVEIERHIPRLVELSGSDESEIRRRISLIYSRINFISDALIPFEYFMNAVPFVRDVDMDDLVFVALNDFMDEKLWTGDIRLYRALKAKGYTRVIKFKEILQELNIED